MKKVTPDKKSFRLRQNIQATQIKIDINRYNFLRPDHQSEEDFEEESDKLSVAPEVNIHFKWERGRGRKGGGAIGLTSNIMTCNENLVPYLFFLKLLLFFHLIKGLKHGHFLVQYFSYEQTLRCRHEIYPIPIKPKVGSQKCGHYFVLSPFKKLLEWDWGGGGAELHTFPESFFIFLFIIRPTMTPMQSVRPLQNNKPLQNHRQPRRMFSPLCRLCPWIHLKQNTSDPSCSVQCQVYRRPELQRAMSGIQATRAATCYVKYIGDPSCSVLCQVYRRPELQRTMSGIQATRAATCYVRYTCCPSYSVLCQVQSGPELQCLSQVQSGPEL